LLPATAILDQPEEVTPRRWTASVTGAARVLVEPLLGPVESEECSRIISRSVGGAVEQRF
jgi:hypothetical protein